MLSLLRIANPQQRKRLGHFLSPDFKSGGTPSGLEYLEKDTPARRSGGFEIRRLKRFDRLIGDLQSPSPGLYLLIQFLLQSYDFITILRSLHEIEVLGGLLHQGGGVGDALL